MMDACRLLEPIADWPDPVECLNEGGASPIVLLCEHASNHIPADYAGLGLAPSDRERHIAWDIGAAAVTRRLAALLDAPAFLGAYSRLLIDLNRPVHVEGSIPVRSEATDIPGNRALPPHERALRERRIFAPFQAQVAAHMAARASRSLPTLLVSIHSFTPVLNGVERPWHAGVLFGQAEAFGRRLIGRLSTDPSLRIGENQPYSVSRDEDFALLVHGDDRGVPAVLIEIRNDGIADEGSVAAWADRIAAALAPEAERR